MSETTMAESVSPAGQMEMGGGDAGSESSLLERGRFLPALALLFVGSGCAALIYEIVWLQLLGLQIGVSAISLGVLLGTFMGGMCIGSLLFPKYVSRRIHPLRVYAMLEAAIGVIGLLELVLVPVVSDLYVHMAVATSAAVYLRAILAAICLLPPTILMGATLPAIARWVESTPRGVSWLGFFYGGNIIGAVGGCMFAGFYLLPNYDMKTATLVAAAINFGVALLGFVLSLMTTHQPEKREEVIEKVSTPRLTGSKWSSPDMWTVYVAIGLSGLTGLGAEVVWTRLLSLMLGATVYTFSNILAIFLLGLGIGSSVGALITRASKDEHSSRHALALCQFLLAGAITWASYSMSHWLPFWPIDAMGTNTPDNPMYKFQLDLAMVCWTVLPGAVLWGASFPLALGALARKGQDAGKLVGGVYAANTVGAIVGSLMFSMVLIPALYTQGAQRLLVLLCVASGVIALMPKLMHAEKERVQGVKGAALGALPLAITMVLVVVVEFGLMMLVSPANWVAVAFGRNSATWMQGASPDVFNPEQRHLMAIWDEARVTYKLWNLRVENGRVRYEEPPSDTDEQKTKTAGWVTKNEGDLMGAMQLRSDLLSKKGFGEEDPAYRFCLFVGEGMNVSVAVTYDTRYDCRYFHGAGKVQASSAPQDMRLQRMLGHISALTNAVRPGHVPGQSDPQDVLVVACGAGVTAGSFVPYKSDITIVDIEPMVPKYVTPQFWQENHNVIPNNADWPYGHEGAYEHTHIVIDDGRHFIKTTSKKFDVITSDPIDPWVKGCAALNTVEYYQMCKEHLKPGGVVALWIPLYESSEATAKSVICTFYKVFPNGVIWSNDYRDGGGVHGYDCVLFAQLDENGGTDKPTRVDLDAIQHYIDTHPMVKDSIDTVGFNSGMAADGTPVPGAGEAVELFSTYAGNAPRMLDWSNKPGKTFGGEEIPVDQLINWDRNLRLQYVAGKWINVKEQVATDIFNGILQNYSFPTEMFSGSRERIDALKKFLDATGRHERGISMDFSPTPSVAPTSDPTPAPAAR